MYASHVPIISRAMLAEPKYFVRACMFAVLSARVQFRRVPEQVKELDRLGEKAPCLWGWKLDAYRFLMEHGARIHAAVIQEPEPEKALALLCEVPGLGIVKGAFVLQMLGHDVACIDVRNAKRDGINVEAFKTRGPRDKEQPAFLRKIARYVSLTFGKSEMLWDRWCNEVGADQGRSGELVSLVHVHCIIGRRGLGAGIRHASLGMDEITIPF